MKRLLICLILLVSCLAITAFAGCGSPSADSGGQSGTEQNIPAGNTPQGSETELPGEDNKQKPTPGNGNNNDNVQTPEEDAADQPADGKEITEMFIYINGNRLKVTLAKNSSAEALVEILKEVDIIFTATENGGFETYGDMGRVLPTNNSQMTAEAGDVILYSGRYLCLFFGSNSWSYTKIGKINGYSASELRTVLGTGSGGTEVRLSLN